jgi:hypothetical protein
LRRLLIGASRLLEINSESPFPASNLPGRKGGYDANRRVAGRYQQFRRLQMTQATGGYSPPHGQQGNPSTPEVAKNEAADVARTAAQGGGQVGETAGDQAKRVASATAEQARDLMQEGRAQLADQAREGQRKAASGLHTLADQFGDMSQKTDGEGLAPELARQASQRTRDIATWLDEREPGALLDEVRRFARRRPGAFLAGAAIAGVLAGRLTRGAVAAGSDDSSSGSSGGSSGSGTGAPAGRSMPVPPPEAMPRPAGPSVPAAPPPVTPPGTFPETPAQYPGTVTR